jgi:hypothetical protein
MPEGGGKDVLVESAAFLAATDRLVVGTGIANIHFRRLVYVRAITAMDSSRGASAIRGTASVVAPLPSAIR